MTTTMITYGNSQVAAWLGVTNAAVSNWLVRHAQEIPRPAVVVVSSSGEETWGWTEGQRAEWAAWHKERNPGGPHKRSMKPRIAAGELGT